MISTNEIRNGAKIEVDGEPFIIVEFQHVKPGKGGAFVRTKLRSLKTGNVVDRTFRSGDKLEEPDIDEMEMQFLYSAEGQYFFMDTKSYEQIFILQEHLGESKNFLKENMVAKIIFYEGKPLSVELPIFVELKIVKTDPGIRGDTATGGTKVATVETGANVKVPLYLEEGAVIKVDTRSGEYVERVK
ncbi:MAG TPA: elongation factor P [Nitrospiria bacterium]|nr:elongation factor P [Nitrospiria bacterium]